MQTSLGCYNRRVHARPWFRCLAGTFLAGAGAWLGIAAAAQATGTIQLTPPSSAGFPQVAFYASVIGPDGRSLRALPPTSFSLTEDGVAIADFVMQEETVGARQIFAVNTVASLRRRDEQGVTRLEQVRLALIDAWTSRPASTVPDQVSLLTAEGSLGINRPAAADLVTALEDWPAVYSGSEVGYGVLMNALAAALDPVPRPGMENDIVFITPLLDRNNEQELGDALSLASAASSRARLHAVLVGTLEQAGTAEALRLRQAAEATGGSFRVFDPAAGFENLETRLQEVRTRYMVEYASPANSSGAHAVQLSVSTLDFAAVSDPAVYAAELAPPQLTFIQPPQTIARRTNDPDTPLVDIPPTFLDLPLLVSFPDGHERPVERLDLFVNGELHETRLEAPFDRVRWDLSSIFETRAFQIRAEVTDSQGLTASTEIIPVSIEVVPGPRGLEALRPALGPLFAGLALVAIGIALTLGWSRLDEWSADPAWAAASPGGMRLLRRARLGTRQPTAAPEAVLLPLRPNGTAGPPVALDGADLMIGSDPALCGLLLDDPSVSGIHARLTRRAAGVFRLRDQHSVAGTWVNDSAVDETGRDLSHGDRIFFGRAAYRFRLAAPASEARVVVLPAPRGLSL
jgi:hypothetical protein